LSNLNENLNGPTIFPHNFEISAYMKLVQYCSGFSMHTNGQMDGVNLKVLVMIANTPAKRAWISQKLDSL
jgi:hypothetical protein